MNETAMCPDCGRKPSERESITKVDGGSYVRDVCAGNVHGLADDLATRALVLFRMRGGPSGPEVPESADGLDLSLKPGMFDGGAL